MTTIQNTSFAAPVRTILHIDMDAFFASVEQRDTPGYRGKPVIVGAAPGSRGVVSAASYEARVFGIHSAMPINEAYARCPQGIFVRPRMEEYSHASGAVMEVLYSFSPGMEQVSIDEAFLDITGTAKLWGTPLQTARAIADRIRHEQRLTASIGIAPNKFLAKIASDCNKPNGITPAPFEAEAIMSWLAPMPVGRLWGVGEKTREAFARMGIRTIGELQQVSPDYLRTRFGQGGGALYRLARGIDDREVGEGGPAKSISREHTFDRDTGDEEMWKRTLLALSREVAQRARREGVKGSTIFFAFRNPDFSRHTRRRTLAEPTNLATTIYEVALELMRSSGASKLRLLGVGITGFGEPLQLDLFHLPGHEEPWRASEKAMDHIAEKFGRNSIVFGGEMRGKRGRGDRADRGG